MVEDCILILLLQINRRIVIYSDMETSYSGWYRNLYY